MFFLTICKVYSTLYSNWNRKRGETVWDNGFRASIFVSSGRPDRNSGIQSIWPMSWSCWSLWWNGRLGWLWDATSIWSAPWRVNLSSLYLRGKIWFATLKKLGRASRKIILEPRPRRWWWQPDQHEWSCWTVSKTGKMNISSLLWGWKLTCPFDLFSSKMHWSWRIVGSGGMQCFFYDNSKRRLL